MTESEFLSHFPFFPKKAISSRMDIGSSCSAVRRPIVTYKIRRLSYHLVFVGRVLNSEVAARKTAFVSDPHGAQRPETQRDRKEKVSFQCRESVEPGAPGNRSEWPQDHLPNQHGKGQECLHLFTAVSLLRNKVNNTPHSWAGQPGSRAQRTLTV